jgi:hypothetical protein
MPPRIGGLIHTDHLVFQGLFITLYAELCKTEEQACKLETQRSLVAISAHGLVTDWRKYPQIRKSGGVVYMHSAPIFFQFDGDNSAQLALDTLQDLGYQPRLTSYDGKPAVHIHVENQDLVSALQIAQSYGGDLVQMSGEEEARFYDETYDLATIPVPAHLVNEDWPSEYLENTAPTSSIDPIRDSVGIQLNTLPVEADRRGEITTDDDVNGFEAGIHI